jgi:hypothetical protein
MSKVHAHGAGILALVPSRIYVITSYIQKDPMARRSVPPPKPKVPILSAGQKRRRIERLQTCITSLEAFDSEKVRKRFGNPEVIALEAAIDKALSSAFGYGTPAYMRYNQAATLDPGPLISNATLRSPGPRTAGGPGQHDLQTAEARQYFSEGRGRSLALLREAIRTLEDEIGAGRPILEAPKSKAVQKTREVQTPQIEPAQAGGSDLKAAWRRVTRWLGRRN